MKKFRFSKRFAKIRQNLSVDLDFNKRRSISLGDFIKILWPILKSLKSVTMYPRLRLVIWSGLALHQFQKN